MHSPRKFVQLSTKPRELSNYIRYLEDDKGFEALSALRTHRVLTKKGRQPKPPPCEQMLMLRLELRTHTELNLPGSKREAAGIGRIGSAKARISG
jgi:hypothetical protein